MFLAEFSFYVAMAGSLGVNSMFSLVRIFEHFVRFTFNDVHRDGDEKDIFCHIPTIEKLNRLPKSIQE